MKNHLLVLLLLVGASVQAQVFMRPFDNAAIMALGGATVAAPGLERGLSNDGQLGLESTRFGVFAGTALPYGLAGWQAHQFQGTFRVGAHSGVGLEILHAGLESYQEQRFQGSYGRRLGDKLLIGAHFQLLRISAQEYGAATGISGGVSILSEPLPNVWLGANLQHPFGVELSGEHLPARLQIGGAWQSSKSVLLLLAVDKDIDRAAQVNAGLEYSPVPAVRIRAGMRTNPGRPSVGIGYRLKNGLGLDAGAEWHPTLGVTPAFMVSWQKA